MRRFKILLLVNSSPLSTFHGTFTWSSNWNSVFAGMNALCLPLKSAWTLVLFLWCQYPCWSPPVAFWRLARVWGGWWVSLSFALTPHVIHTCICARSHSWACAHTVARTLKRRHTRAHTHIQTWIVGTSHSSASCKPHFVPCQIAWLGVDQWVGDNSWRGDQFTRSTSLIHLLDETLMCRDTRLGKASPGKVSDGAEPSFLKRAASILFRSVADMLTWGNVYNVLWLLLCRRVLSTVVTSLPAQRSKRTCVKRWGGFHWLYMYV